MDVIRVVGAREHNLKGIDLEIPRDSLVVVTGLSGSGKSSLAFDTIYQEGQRRFLESLSAYARQFLGSLEKPRVDRIDGLSPTLCIDQKTVNRNPRSTVGTITEIQDHLRLWMARLGTPRCPVCSRAITTLSPGQIADVLMRDAPGAALVVLGPIVRDRKGEYRKELAQALKDGYLRARVDGELRSLEEEISLARYEKHTIELVVDRLKVHPERRERLVEALERGLKLGEGVVSVLIGEVYRSFSSSRSCPEHGISIPEMEPRLFSFNAPQGMCTGCSGLGYLEDFDLDLLFDPKALYSEALRALEDDEPLPFSTLSREVLAEIGRQLGVPAKTRWKDLSEAHREALLHGADIQYQVTRAGETRSVTHDKRWSGILPILAYVWKFTWLSRLGGFRRQMKCEVCHGRRLNPVALAVDYRGQGIASLSAMTVDQAQAFFGPLVLEGPEAQVGDPILREIRGRLAFLDQVGLGYLALDRSAATLSGGEGQRIRLASQVGAGLQGVTYVLDEPSIGLHTRDQARLLDALEQLRDKGNTVIVVEHDPDTMTRADYLIEVGPGAGREGGQLVAAGPPKKFLQSNARTARYLRGELRIPLPATRRPGNGAALQIRGAKANNLKGLDVRVPLGCFVAVTGVSGSGKSSLILDVLYKTLAAELHGARVRPGAHTAVDGIQHLDKVIEIDQAPIGRTPRSNPMTYTGAFDSIRDLFAELPEARARGYKKGRFSFNVRGGRCEECQGAGIKTVEMQFLADVEVPCEACAGKRFNPETLEIRYKGRTITDVLDMSIADAGQLFAHQRKIHRVLTTLERVGLGYVALGQPSTTLSGGEAQRIKLATELQRPATGKTLYILDEPTTGLHLDDIQRLLGALQELVDAGNTVLVIEHNTDVIKVADHVIDLGPEGGEGGGRLVGQGTPEAVAKLDTPTGRVLRELLKHEAPSGLASEAPPSPYTFTERPRARARRHRGTDLMLRGVHTHNLKGVDIDLPRGKMTVITGVSGSGKTSLAFDTLFAEGQRRYVESLSTYARRFLGRLDRAPVDKVEGLAPAIAIDQRNSGHNPRSTVATVTEIYDSLRLLYARIGRLHCPVCSRPLRAASPVVAAAQLRAADPGPGWLVADLPAGTKAGDWMRDGFARVLGPKRAERELTDPEELLPATALVVDRLNPAKTAPERLSEAVTTAYGHGGDRARFVPRGEGTELVLTRAAICPDHGRLLPEDLTPRHFSFNTHLGACAACLGLGRRAAVDPELLLPRPELPLAEALDARVGAMVLRTPRTEALMAALFAQHKVDPATPVKKWPPKLRRALLYGVAEPLTISWKRAWGRSVSAITESLPWTGLIPIIDGWAGKTAWLRRETVCPDCEGARLRRELQAITIGDAAPARDGGPPGHPIASASAMTVHEARAFWGGIVLRGEEKAIAEQVLQELSARLGFLEDVGLGYLTLDRAADTLSGGESQRIRLATQLGAKLTGVLYVLDEPTVGLHQRDTARLLQTLLGLRALGNTLVVVEHDPEIMRAADHIIDMGPGAGEHGGRVMATGTPAQISASETLTGAYLSGREHIPAPRTRRKPTGWLEAPSANLHNLKDVAARIPRGCLTAVTGVSGSGKSTLVMEIFAPWLPTIKNGPRVVLVDQKPIGRTPRSTPASYCGILDPIRELFADTALARERGYLSNRFSYNHADGGRCVHCEGRGAAQIEMHFLSDVWIRCDHCRGRRFDAATLDIRWRDHSIADVLDLTVDDAIPLFERQKRVARRLVALADVGLGYVRLGQAAPTLSGGEAQRMKLAEELVSRSVETVYILDEPTTGLHFADVAKLVGVLHRLVDAGHAVVVIEHHLDIIRNADHVIDLGPEGGEAGGRILAEGTPEKIQATPGSWTGVALGG